VREKKCGGGEKGGGKRERGGKEGRRDSTRLVSYPLLKDSSERW
jgi:hypothetical protein